MSDRSDLVSSLIAYHVRLWLGGLLTLVVMPVSLAAAALNFLSGQGPDVGPYATVHDRAARLDAQIRSMQHTPRQRAADSAAVGRRPRVSA